MITELEKTSKIELDFTYEANNLDRFYDMLYLVHKSLKKDDPRPQVVEYMDHICKLVMISVVIMVIGAILGLMFWSPLLTIALIAAAIFITVRESQEKKREGLPDE